MGVKSKLFIFCCILQSISGFYRPYDDISRFIGAHFAGHNNNKFTFFIVFPPDVASTRIVGGEKSKDGDAPYQCSIQDWMMESHYCGCSIISDK